MPINIERLEPGIFRAECIGQLTIEDILARMREITALAEKSGDANWVLLADLTQSNKIPFDMKTLTNSANAAKSAAGYIFVNAPYVGQVIGNMLDKLSAKKFSFADSMEDGLAQAHSILSEFVSTNQ